MYVIPCSGRESRKEQAAVAGSWRSLFYTAISRQVCPYLCGAIFKLILHWRSCTALLRLSLLKIPFGNCTSLMFVKVYGCSVQALIKDMSGKSPLYKKWVLPSLRICTILLSDMLHGSSYWIFRLSDHFENPYCRDCTRNFWHSDVGFMTGHLCSLALQFLVICSSQSRTKHLFCLELQFFER